jgi:hypothetical protein
MKKAVWLILVVVVVVIIVWLWYPTEKRKLKSDILSMKKAVEVEYMDMIMEYIDLQYLDEKNLTHDEIVAVITQFFAEVDSIRVQMGGMELNIDSTGKEKTVFASCSLGVRVLARYEGERVLAYGGLVKPGTVRARFRRTDSKYKIYYAEY